MLDGIVHTFLKPGRVKYGDMIETKGLVASRWAALEDDKRRELAREFLTVVVQLKTVRERVDTVHKVVLTPNGNAENEYGM